MTTDLKSRTHKIPGHKKGNRAPKEIIVLMGPYCERCYSDVYPPIGKEDERANLRIAARWFGKLTERIRFRYYPLAENELAAAEIGKKVACALERVQSFSTLSGMHGGSVELELLFSRTKKSGDGADVVMINHAMNFVLLRNLLLMVGFRSYFKPGEPVPFFPKTGSLLVINAGNRECSYFSPEWLDRLAL